MIQPDAEEEEPARERRLSRPMRIGAALALVMVAWGTLWLARPRTSSPQKSGVTPAASPLGDAPVKVGSRYLCMKGEEIRAFDWLQMSFYTTNNPFAPLLTAIPDRCFGTPAEAEAAGYRLGPIPPDDGAEVDGIYLIHPEQAFTDQCLRTAQQLGFRVPCPDLLPWPGRNLGFSTCSYDQAVDVCTDEGAFVLQESRFAVPVGHQSLPPGLVVPAVEENSLNSSLTCPEGVRTSTDLIRVQNEDRDISAAVIECPLGATEILIEGHLILRWKDAGLTYEVALYDNFDDTVALLEAIASNLQVIGPPAT